jgi:hypothetical protein
MARTRPAVVLLAVLALLAALTANAAAAEGVSKARPVGKTTTSSTKLTKEQLAASTQSPADGQTVTGAIAWQVGVSGATASRVDFAIDGTVKWSQSTSPYAYGGSGGTLDTTALSNGAHTLSATAYGAKGIKATTRVTVTVANATPEPAPEPAPEPLPETSSGGPIYWGATIGPQLTGSQAPWDMTAVTRFEELTKKRVSLVQFFMPFANCSTACTYYSFPKTPLENVRLHGSIPVLSWSSASLPSSLNQPDFQLSDVIEGRHDAYIRKFAEAAKAWGRPFFIRFNWEMNGGWFSWSERNNGNQPGQYVAAWRHVHDIFTAVGATNATWVWCPNIDPTNSFQSLASLYPGDAYVDWTALDGYNWGTNPAKPGGWKTFDQLYRSTYNSIVGSIAPSKPMMVAEIASSEYGGSKAAWIKEMLAKVPTEYKAIRSLLWFDHFSDGMDWPIETSNTGTTAFAEAIQSPVYAGNTFGELSASAILPLS